MRLDEKACSAVQWCSAVERHSAEGLRVMCGEVNEGEVAKSFIIQNDIHCTALHCTAAQNRITALHGTAPVHH